MDFHGVEGSQRSGSGLTVGVVFACICNHVNESMRWLASLAFTQFSVRFDVSGLIMGQRKHSERHLGVRSGVHSA